MDQGAEYGMVESISPIIAPSTAIAELFVLLALADHPIDEAELAACQAALDALRADNVHFAELLAPLRPLHLIEALGHVHTFIALEAARQKYARDLGKTLAFLPPKDKARLCRVAEDFLAARCAKTGAELYQTFLSRMA